MCDSLTFFMNLPGEPILRGESWFYCCTVSLFAIFEFDDGYALYCVMLLYKGAGSACFFNNYLNI